MQSNCKPIPVPGLLSQRIQHISLQRQCHVVSTLTSCLSTVSFSADLHHGGFCLGGVGGGFGPAHIGTATRPMGENAACSGPRAPTWRRGSRSLEQAQNSYQCGRRHLLTPAAWTPLVRLSQGKQRQRVLMGHSGYQQRSAWGLV